MGLMSRVGCKSYADSTINETSPFEANSRSGLNSSASHFLSALGVSLTMVSSRGWHSGIKLRGDEDLILSSPCYIVSMWVATCAAVYLHWGIIRKAGHHLFSRRLGLNGISRK